MGEAGELSGAGEAQREREARFERLGASPELAAYLSTFEEKPRGYGLLLSAQLAVLFAAIALLVLAIRSLAAASETRALTAAADVGAVLYETNFGFSWLPAFVAMIFLWVPAASLVSALLPTRLQHAYFAKGLLDSMNQAWAAAWVRRGFASIPAHYSPEQMIDHVNEATLRPCTAFGVALALVSAVLVPRDLATHTLYSPRGVHPSAMLPWVDDSARPFAAATAVVLGCNHVTGRNASDDIHYEIHFADGAEFDLYGAKPVRGGWLDHAERIDAELRRAAVPFYRWRWLKRNPLHPACLSVQRAKYRPNGAERIDRLLRVREPLAPEP